MNDDLISRDKLIDNLKTHFDALYREDGELLASDHICNSEDVNDLVELVNNQPTAFDVDKVISNIWDRSELIHIKHNCYDEVEDYIRVTDVSEIVRDGGLDETK